ncbi:uncharacterized protein LOC114540531 [Dendronephthya gigantea]|uniref:uncharacterized protein LOC114540531 n=1 Tax=Dendronephthya gigantea TaxID=151771 RepID=UPI00106D3581|nr:uncharacterized protein LOC114540531 [Dendronephthya gigantea]
MYRCKAPTCFHRSRSLGAYANHYRLHSNEANVTFPCAVKNCARRFRTYSAFKSHVTRDHENARREGSNTVSSAPIQCQCSFCSKFLQSIKDLIAHQKDHITQGVEVTCPFNGCNSKFKIKSSFTSHLSRRHKNPANREVSSELLVHVNSQATNNTSNLSQFDGFDSGETSNNDNLENDDTQEDISELFVKNLALFYLKLNAKYHVPASTIQKIIQEMQAMHNMSQTHLKHHIKTKLGEMSVGSAVIDQIVNEFLPNDIFNLAHGNKGALSTEYRRKQFFRSKFRYVAPVTIYLGFDKNHVKRYFEYVPIIETIQELLKDAGVKKQFANPILNSDDILRDFMDGSVAKSNVLFVELGNAIKLILYQDAFEVVNPLGSAKKKHKVLAVYVTLGNIYPQNRSQIDQMQLVLLVRESDFKFFGQDAVFRILVNDLKKIEEHGVLVEKEYIRGTVTMILGDNLGSHSIGGFVENFSSSPYVCRFCLMETKNIQLGDIFDTFSQRSPDNYNANLQNVESNPDLGNYKGIKFNSIFNELKYYHVCNPGLPPCLGHDLFEGVVNYDLALYIHHFVKVNKWFTYAQFNHIVAKFKYSGSDANNKPSIISEQGSKLGGHAVQNWCLLKLLPLYIGPRVANTCDPVWQLTLLLREVVELICAPEISLAQVAHLRVKIEDIRAKSFTLS